MRRLKTIRQHLRKAEIQLRDYAKYNHFPPEDMSLDISPMLQQILDMETDIIWQESTEALYLYEAEKLQKQLGINA